MTYHVTTPWTGERLDLLHRLTTVEGYSAGKIAFEFTNHPDPAIQFPFTRNSIIGKQHRVHISRPMNGPVVYFKCSNPSGTSRGKRTVRVPNGEPRRATKAKIKASWKSAVHFQEESKNKVKLLDVERHHCRWPIGDPMKINDGFWFCGNDKLHPDIAWCGYHCRMAYQ